MLPWQTSWQDEVSTLREQLQAAKTQLPQQITPSPSPPINNNNPPPPSDSPVNNPSSLPHPHVSPVTIKQQPPPVTQDVVTTLSESTLIPAPELVEVSDMRPDTTSGEDSGGPDKPHSRGRRGKKGGRSKVILPVHTQTEHQEPHIDLAHGSTEEESDIETTAMTLRRKRRRKLTNLTADVSHAIVAQLNEGGKETGGGKSPPNKEDTGKDQVNDRGKMAEGEVTKEDEFTNTTTLLDPMVPTRGRGRGRGRPRKRTSLDRISSSIPTTRRDTSSPAEVKGLPTDNVLPSGVEYVLPDNQPSESLIISVTTVAGVGTAVRKRGRPKGSGKGRRKVHGRPRVNTSITNPTPADGDQNVPIVFVTVPSNNEPTVITASDKAAPSDTPMICTSSDSDKTTETNTKQEKKEENVIESTTAVAIDSVAPIEVVADSEHNIISDRQHSPSPEIPLQNSSQNSASSPEATLCGLRKASSGGGHLLEKIVNSLVERSHVSARGEGVRGGRGGRGKRKTLTAKKPTQKLSIVDNDQVSCP